MIAADGVHLSSPYTKYTTDIKKPGDHYQIAIPDVYWLVRNNYTVTRHLLKHCIRSISHAVPLCNNMHIALSHFNLSTMNDQ